MPTFSINQLFPHLEFYHGDALLCLILYCLVMYCLLCIVLLLLFYRYSFVRYCFVMYRLLCIVCYVLFVMYCFCFVLRGGICVHILCAIYAVFMYIFVMLMFFVSFQGVANCDFPTIKL